MNITPAPAVSYTLLGDPETVDPLIDAIESYLHGTESSSPTVLIDDISGLYTVYESVHAGRVLTRLSSLTDDLGSRVAIGCCAMDFRRADLESLLRIIDEVYGVPAAVVRAVARLEREDSTTMGYTRRHWQEALDGIEQCDRNYPQSKQIHAALENPETTTRTLGATLSGLVRLGVLETWGETVGATRYDLTAYDIGYGFAAGITLEAMPSAVHVFPRR